MRFEAGQQIHIIGIGGFGMSAIARVLLLRGHSVTGSDRKRNDLTAALVHDGAVIYEGHAAEQVGAADMVLASSAVPDDHVEIVAARNRGIPVYRRKDIMAPLMEGQTVIAVAGTHGKTTTTSMVVHILRACGQDPSYIVGGVMANTGTNAGVGQDDVFVIEADEYGNMFHGLKPDIIVLTNVEYDHPDFFKTEDDLIGSYRQFLALLPNFGTLIACSDNLWAETLLNELRHEEQLRQQQGHYGMRNLIAYGLRDNDNTSIVGVRQDGAESGTRFDVEMMFMGVRGVMAQVDLPLVGDYNVQNAIGALIAANRVGVSFQDGAAAMVSFQTTGRRFEVKGEVNGVTVIDDYAHHPTAIRVTLEAARARYPDHALWAVWQPHMYSRTQLLIEQYATAFTAADFVLVTDIYAAREAPIPGVDGAWTAAQIQHPQAVHGGSVAACTDYLLKNVKNPAILLIMSAGDAPQIGQEFLANFAES